MKQLLRRQIKEIVSLTDDEFEYVFSHFTLRKQKKHQFIVQAGGFVEHEYFVINGLLKASFLNEQGKEHIIQFAMENWWVTDYLAFSKQTRANLNIDCLEDSTLFSITFANKKKLCEESHKMEHFFRIKTTSGYVNLQQRVLSLLNNDAQSRYNQLLVQYPSLFQRVPKALLAAYLGVSRETLSRFSIK